MSDERTAQSDYLLELGKKILEPYTELPAARAAMMTGSVAEGISDNYSDLDMTVYYENELPDEAELARIRQENGAAERVWLLGDRADGNIAEAYELHGIQAQIGHTTIAAWENEIAEVMERFNTDTPSHKAMSGTLESLSVYGDEYMDRWKEKIAAYPDGLARAMVEKHLTFFPYWYVQKQMEMRDATLWHYQILTEAAYNLVAILAGLNRLYFTSFQFKKMRRFIEPMKYKPEKLAERLENLFKQDPSNAAVSLEGLVTDVVELVEQQMPEVDVRGVKKGLGKRRQPWVMQQSAPQMINHPIFNLIGIETRTSNTRETNPETARIGELWERFYTTQLVEQIPNRVDSDLVYGLYHKYDSNYKGAYSLLVGVQVKTLDQTPERLSGVTIPEGRYLVFSHPGNSPDVVMETWKQIWAHFENLSDTVRAYTADFEVYHPDHIEIYIRDSR